MMDAEKKAMQRRIDKLDQYAARLHAALTGAEREIARLTRNWKPSSVRGMR